MVQMYIYIYIYKYEVKYINNRYFSLTLSLSPHLPKEVIERLCIGNKNLLALYDTRLFTLNLFIKNIVLNFIWQGFVSELVVVVVVAFSKCVHGSFFILKHFAFISLITSAGSTFLPDPTIFAGYGLRAKYNTDPARTGLLPCSTRRRRGGRESRRTWRSACASTRSLSTTSTGLTEE